MVIGDLKKRQSELFDLQRKLQDKKKLNEMQVSEYHTKLKDVSKSIFAYIRGQADNKSLALMSDEAGLVRANSLEQLLKQLTSEHEGVKKRRD